MTEETTKNTDLGSKLLNAVSRWKTDLALSLIEQGADVNYIDPLLKNTPLLEAARLGNGQVLRKLIEKGADVNYVRHWPRDEKYAQLSEGRGGSAKTTTPLAEALLYEFNHGGFTEEIKLLKSRGAKAVWDGDGVPFPPDDFSVKE